MWAHKLLDDADSFNLKQCLFGEHLLSQDNSNTVAIVESEKSALIASHYLPNYTWLATGGKDICMRDDNLKVLQGRRVILFPDLGATERWRTKIAIFERLGIDVKLFETLEENATNEQRQSGYDIADFLLDGNSPEAILQKMIVQNPLIQELIDALDLELIGRD